MWQLTFVKGSAAPVTVQVGNPVRFVEVCRDRIGMGWLLMRVEVL